MTATYPGARTCPYEPSFSYAAWRRAEGLQRATLLDGTEVWVVTRYADVRAVLADPLNPNLPGSKLGFRTSREWTTRSTPRH